MSTPPPPISGFTGITDSCYPDKQLSRNEQLKVDQLCEFSEFSSCEERYLQLIRDMREAERKYHNANDYWETNNRIDNLFQQLNNSISKLPLEAQSFLDIEDLIEILFKEETRDALSMCITQAQY